MVILTRAISASHCQLPPRVLREGEGPLSSSSRPDYARVWQLVTITVVTSDEKKILCTLKINVGQACS